MAVSRRTRFRQVDDGNTSMVQLSLRPMLANGTSNHRSVSCVSTIVVTLLFVSTIGCTKPPEFRQNAVEVRKQEINFNLEEGQSYPEQTLLDIGSLLTSLFGTPDSPRFPIEFSGDYEGILPDDPVVDLERLRMAAGPVLSLEDGTARGLYREHCVHCHGITGDGAGPTASHLNPYPRDFRMGVFKFKSTPSTARPTRDDLRRVLRQGIPGTGMQSFNLLPDEEIEALVDYVIYLSIRGEVERTLLALIPDEFAPEFEENTAIFSDEIEEDTLFDNIIFLLEDFTIPIIDRWRANPSRVTTVPPRPEAFHLGNPEREAKIDRGRELFMSATSGNCFFCHGYTGLGDGATSNYDDWTKDWMEGARLDPDDHEAIQEFVDLGAMPPRFVRPRNLRLGVYRGGREPADLFLRIKNGIAGSPMPGAAQSLSDDDIWCLVEYVRHLPYEPLSQPGSTLETNERSTR